MRILPHQNTQRGLWVQGLAHFRLRSSLFGVLLSLRGDPMEDQSVVNPMHLFRVRQQSEMKASNQFCFVFKCHGQRTPSEVKRKFPPPFRHCTERWEPEPDYPQGEEGGRGHLHLPGLQCPWLCESRDTLHNRRSV